MQETVGAIVKSGSGNLQLLRSSAQRFGIALELRGAHTCRILALSQGQARKSGSGAGVFPAGDGSWTVSLVAATRREGALQASRYRAAMCGTCAALSSLLSYIPQTRCAFADMSPFFPDGPAALTHNAEPAQTTLHIHTLRLVAKAHNSLHVQLAMR